jgi:elongator complex protein 3
LGLGTKLIAQAKELSKEAGFKKLNVISAIGTKEYYRKKGFSDGQLYQYMELE